MKKRRAIRKIVKPVGTKEKQTQKAFLLLSYLFLAIVAGIFIVPLLNNDFRLSLTNSFLLYILFVSVFFFLLYLSFVKRKWEKVKDPPAWVLKKKRKLGKKFFGQFVMEGPHYNYLLVRDKLTGTTYYRKKKGKT